ncbi:MAG: tryptophan synthase subunit alpha [Christensenellaceae bacterium]|jgi:tryptophan synthase alpha chain|nr:tryptophan synthase subunit alpha [Christensenellaceae bacterium]
MSNIGKAFLKGKAFIPFITAGDPTMEHSYNYIIEMAKSGADIIEIGIPFSDPIAEGPVIQRANIRALKNNVTLFDVFSLTKKVREKTNVPIVYLTYYNPILKFGVEEFFNTCQKSGVDGVIIPDLPFEESGEVLPFSNKAHVDLISLIAPTSKERIYKLATNAQGYIYLVSSMGVTGVRSEIANDLNLIVDEIRNLTDVPVCVGFGINTESQAREISKFADGIIVGSAIVSIIENYCENAKDEIIKYVTKMKAALI